MLEAPEALYLSGQLDSVVKGKRVSDVFVGETPHKFTFYAGKPEEYAERLLGRTIDGARAYGGMVELALGEIRLVFTDGANLRYYAPGEKLPVKHQLLLGFDDQSCLVVSVRMYGGILCFPDGRFHSSLAPYYEQAREKPQVMSEAFDRAYFETLLREESAGNKSAKAFLATGQAVPGLGNGVLQDILYRAGIHPRRKMKTLSGEEETILFQAVRETLQEMYRAGGRNTETDLSGQRGRYVPFLSKDTAGTRCPRCGEVIRKEAYLGGSVYYCSGCQELK